MDVDDAELLALAGGDSSDEESPPAAASMAKAASPLPPSGSTQHYAKVAFSRCEQFYSQCIR